MRHTTSETTMSDTDSIITRSKLLVVPTAIGAMLLAPTLLPTATGPMSQGAAAMSRAVRYRVEVPAAIEEVWAVWTDPARIPEWFARGANIELKPLGKFEILFAPDNPPGKRGAENNLVLAVQAPQMLAFTWDAPPHLPAAREQRTSVVLHFESLAPDRTRVWLAQTGWGRGGEWDQAFEYFTGAWKSVLSLLHYRFTVGPIGREQKLGETVLAEHGKSVSAW